MARKGYEVESVIDFGRFKSRRAAIEHVCMFIETTMSVNGSGTYKLVDIGSGSYKVTRTTYTQRRKA